MKISSIMDCALASFLLSGFVVAIVDPTLPERLFGYHQFSWMVPIFLGLVLCTQMIDVIERCKKR